MKRGVVFFDFDGTLLNSFSLYYKTTNHLFPSMSEDEYRAIFCGQDFTQHSIIQQENKLEFFSLISQHSHLYDIFPGVLDGLQSLAREFDLVIVTACPKTIVKHQLSRFETPRFSKIYAMEKPGTKRDKIEHYCHSHDIPLEHCFFVTDTLGDLLQVAETPLVKIATTYGFHGPELLSQGSAHALCDSFTQVVETINTYKKTPQESVYSV